MTRYLVVTTCNAEQWRQYGMKMAETFREHWSQDVPLWLYAEGFWPEVSMMPAGAICALDLSAPWLPLFKQIYQDPMFNGGLDRRDYRRDAVRFAHKVAAIGAAAETADCDVLIWCDADTVTHESVTVKWLDSLFPERAEIAWLDRERAYPECGFLMFRLPAAKKLISTVVDAYREGAIFKLPETHDSYVFAHFVQRMGIKTHSLSGPEGRRHIGHPWVSSASRGETRSPQGRDSQGAWTVAEERS